jgi:hypothetical protein
MEVKNRFQSREGALYHMPNTQLILKVLIVILNLDSGERTRATGVVCGSL